MNSIRNVQRAIDYEIDRQIVELEKGHPIISETRTFDANKGKTYGMRAKEELNDYRYFPDPDLSPLEVSETWLREIKESMPPLPHELYEKYIKTYQLPEYDAFVITDSKEVALYFEEVCRYTRNYKAASNWVMGPVKSYLNEHNLDISELPISAARLAELIALIDEGHLSFSIASQRLFPMMTRDAVRPIMDIARELNLIQDRSEDSISPLVDEVIKEFPLKVEEFHNGKKAIISMFMGEMMKRSKGKADPKLANELLLKKLAK